MALTLYWIKREMTKSWWISRKPKGQWTGAPSEMPVEIVEHENLKEGGCGPPPPTEISEWMI